LKNGTTYLQKHSNDITEEYHEQQLKPKFRAGTDRRLVIVRIDVSYADESTWAREASELPNHIGCFKRRLSGKQVPCKMSEALPPWEGPRKGNNFNFYCIFLAFLRHDDVRGNIWRSGGRDTMHLVGSFLL
jgi:hypothetical protein